VPNWTYGFENAMAIDEYGYIRFISKSDRIDPGGISRYEGLLLYGKGL